MCSDAAIQTSHVTSSSPRIFAKPEPGAGQPPEHERGQRRGQQAHHLDQQKEPERSDHCGRGGYLPRPCRSTSRSPNCRCTSRPTRSSASPASCPPASSGCSTVFALEGRRRDRARRGRHLRGGGPRGADRRRPGARLAGEWTFDSFSEHLATLDLFPGFTPAAARLPQLPPVGLRVRGAGPRAAPGEHVAARRCSAAPPSRSRSSSPRGWATRRRSIRSRAGSRSTRTSASSSTARRTGPTS